MQKRRLYLLLIGVGAVGAVFAVMFRSREPEYGGRRLSEWVDSYGKVTLREGDVSEREERVRNFISRENGELGLGTLRIVEKIDVPDDPKLDAQALQAILHFGTNAIPYLLNWIANEEPGGGIRMSNVVYTRYGSGIGRDQIVRAVGAMRALSALRGNAATAVPDLARLMNDSRAPNRARRATTVLQNLKLELPTAAIALMTNTSQQVRLDAIQVVASSATLLRLALPALIQSLQDTDAEVAATAAQLLGIARLEANLVVPALTTILNDKRFVLRERATEALGRFHRQALPAVPALLALLKDPEARIRRSASDALANIDPKALERATR